MLHVSEAMEASISQDFRDVANRVEHVAVAIKSLNPNGPCLFSASQNFRRRNFQGLAQLLFELEGISNRWDFHQ